MASSRRVRDTRRPNVGNGRRSPSTSWADAGPLTLTRDRIAGFALVFGLMIFMCVGRLVYLDVVVGAEYAADAQASRTVTLETTPRRGTIYDRNGVVLACSVDATTIYVNPKEVTNAKAEAASLASVLGGEVSDYEDILKTQGTSFAYVKRQADVDVAQRVKDLGLDGIYFLKDTKRTYPCGEVAGQVVGFCNTDGEGIAGLELYYDDILKGSAGKGEVQYGLDGTPIPGHSQTENAVVNGTDIMISIDVEMQAYAEEMLKKYAEIWGVDTDMLMMDGGTGEIYAAASLPLFNPANPSESKEGATQVKIITGSFEPGSIFKTVSAMSVLTHNVMDTEDTLDCPSELEANGYVISDAHAREDVTYSLREIIQYSSNVGISLAVEKEGFRPFYDDIVAWGLNEETGIDYPGEPSGYLLNFDNWSKIQGYNITFGQGITVTPLQMVRYYGALVNNGVAATPHFLIAYPETQEQPEYAQEKIVDDSEAIDKMVSMLESVVTDGTAKAAAIDGYAVAGKTGTAEVASDTGGYKEDVYNISFTGFLAHSSSRLVCFAGSLELPADGSTTMMFRDIMAFAIDRYKIAAEAD